MLRATAQEMVQPGKGILAADESVPTISKRFAALGIESTEESRRSYRELLCTAPQLDAYVSAMILHVETLGQRAGDGTPLPAVLGARGIAPGIKIDTGVTPLAGSPAETVTEGLDGLRDRLARSASLGARFAKWRAVVRIADGLPTPGCVLANAHALARYAALCQEGGLVPIVEPEVLMEGDHDLARCDHVTRAVLLEVFAQLRVAGVDLRSIVLKPSMVVAGADAPAATVDDVAEATTRCLADCVPVSVPGIAFLSGGQSPRVATIHLDAIARRGPHPWSVTFSYGRALQDDVLRSWAGEAANRAEAEAVLAQRARCNAAAAGGRYDAGMEAA